MDNRVLKMQVSVATTTIVIEQIRITHFFLIHK